MPGTVMMFLEPPPAPDRNQPADPITRQIYHGNGIACYSTHRASVSSCEAGVESLVLQMTRHLQRSADRLANHLYRRLKRSHLSCR